MKPIAAQEQIDTLWRVETPEGVDLQAQIAGPIPRMLAYGVDFFIRMAALMALSIAFSVVGFAGLGLQMICIFLLEWFYPVYFEVFHKGQTPGKKQFGLAVVNDDLTPVMPGTSFTRNLLRAADFLPFLFVGGIISMLCTRQFRRLGDLAAGTLVIHLPPVQYQDQLPQAQPQTPTMPLNSDDQTAIIDFTRRHNRLSQPRQEELASILSPSLSLPQGEAGVNKLRGLGLWLLGGKQK